MSRKRPKRVDPDDLRSIHLAFRKDGTPVYKPYVYDSSRTSSKRWLGTFESLGMAQAARNTANEQAPRADRELTVAELIERFLHFEGEDAPTERTRDRYRAALKPLTKKFGRRYATAISRPVARQWGREQPVSVTDTARTLFNWAIREELASRNPFANLRRRRPRGRSDIQVLDELELVALANVAISKWGAYGTVIRTMILLAGYTGMRLAEIWALRWRDIDLEGEIVHVRWQLETLSTKMLKRRVDELRRRGDPCMEVPGGVLWRPKNTEERTIVLLPEAAEAIGDLARHISSEFLFLTNGGALFSKSKHHYYWDPVRAGFTESLPRTHWLRERIDGLGPNGNYDFHELRHLHSSMLANAEVVQSDNALQLGHRDGGELVRRRYAHPDEELARERIREHWARRSRAPSAGGRASAAETDDGA